MKQLLNVLIEKKIKNDYTSGLLLIEKELCSKSNPELDVVLIKICNEPTIHTASFHFEINNKSVDVQVIHEQQIPLILINGQNRRLIDWLLNGEILLEKNNYLTALRAGIQEFPLKERKFKSAVEFSKLIRRYTDGKQLFHNGHYLDSFNSILHSLHHLARISIIEAGLYPEVTVWRQVKQTEPEIYKLYEEMVTGEECLEKRIELLLIAVNFAITSKTKLGSSHLLEKIREANGPRSMEQLQNDPELKEYGIDLPVFIDYLVHKGHIDIFRSETELPEVFERRYSIK